MPEKKLLIVGDGSDANRLRKLAGKNIIFKGFMTASEIKPLLQKARAFVFTSKEDFGIAVIEALACGTPVIAYGQGGVLDSVYHDKSGFLFKEQTVESMVNAVHDFEKLQFDYKTISNYAKIFSKERFQEEFKSFVEKCIKEKNV